MNPRVVVENTAMNLAVVVLLVAAVAWPTTGVADNKRWGANYFPNVELTTQDGQVVHFYDDLIKGKIVVINLIYTHCVDACPLETARLVQVQKMLGDMVGKDIFFYSITIDPKRDTPAVLKDYADKYHAGPGWTFLTGKKADIDLLSKKIGLYQEPDPNDRDGHMPEVLIGNEPTGQWFLNGAADNPRFLASLIGDRANAWKLTLANKNNTVAQPQAINIERGRYVFTTHCAACHTVGHGDKIGPDLINVTDIRDPKWLAQFIQTPEKMITEGDPLAKALFEKYRQIRMPNLRIGDEDIAELIDFLKKQSKSPDGAVAAGKNDTPRSAAGSSSVSLNTASHQ